jgi:hypothetical protein
MSLKAFHIFFIVLSILMSFFSAAWLLYQNAQAHDTAELIVGILFIIAGGALVIYGKSVLRKLKHISYL